MIVLLDIYIYFFFSQNERKSFCSRWAISRPGDLLLAPYSQAGTRFGTRHEREKKAFNGRAAWLEIPAQKTQARKQ